MWQLLSSDVDSIRITTGGRTTMPNTPGESHRPLFGGRLANHLARTSHRSDRGLHERLQRTGEHDAVTGLPAATPTIDSTLDAAPEA
jgi:hypothetical protein